MCFIIKVVIYQCWQIESVLIRASKAIFWFFDFYQLTFCCCCGFLFHDIKEEKRTVYTRIGVCVYVTCACACVCVCDKLQKNHSIADLNYRIAQQFSRLFIKMGIKNFVPMGFYLFIYLCVWLLFASCKFGKYYTHSVPHWYTSTVRSTMRMWMCENPWETKSKVNKIYLPSGGIKSWYRR